MKETNLWRKWKGSDPQFSDITAGKWKTLQNNTFLGRGKVILGWGRGAKMLLSFREQPFGLNIIVPPSEIV